MKSDKGNNINHNKIAVVTGGSRNIGYAIAHKFYDLGYNVSILSVTANSAKTAAKSIDKSGTRVIGFKCDVTDESSVVDALEKTNAIFGGIDILYVIFRAKAQRTAWSANLCALQFKNVTTKFC